MTSNNMAETATLVKTDRLESLLTLLHSLGVNEDEMDCLSQSYKSNDDGPALSPLNKEKGSHVSKKVDYDDDDDDDVRSVAQHKLINDDESVLDLVRKLKAPLVVFNQSVNKKIGIDNERKSASEEEDEEDEEDEEEDSSDEEDDNDGVSRDFDDTCNETVGDQTFINNLLSSGPSTTAVSTSPKSRRTVASVAISRDESNTTESDSDEDEEESDKSSSSNESSSQETEEENHSKGDSLKSGSDHSKEFTVGDETFVRNLILNQPQVLPQSTTKPSIGSHNSSRQKDLTSISPIRRSLDVGANFKGHESKNDDISVTHQLKAQQAEAQKMFKSLNTPLITDDSQRKVSRSLQSTNARKDEHLPALTKLPETDKRHFEEDDITIIREIKAQQREAEKTMASFKSQDIISVDAKSVFSQTKKKATGAKYETKKEKEIIIGDEIVERIKVKQNEASKLISNLATGRNNDRKESNLSPLKVKKDNDISKVNSSSGLGATKGTEKVSLYDVLLSKTSAERQNEAVQKVQETFGLHANAMKNPTVVDTIGKNSNVRAETLPVFVNKIVDLEEFTEKCDVYQPDERVGQFLYVEDDYSDDISVMSDVTSFTTTGGIHVVDEKHYCYTQNQHPPIVINGGPGESLPPMIVAPPKSKNLLDKVASRTPVAAVQSSFRQRPLASVAGTKTRDYKNAMSNLQDKVPPPIKDYKNAMAKLNERPLSPVKDYKKSMANLGERPRIFTKTHESTTTEFGELPYTTKGNISNTTSLQTRRPYLDANDKKCKIEPQSRTKSVVNENKNGLMKVQEPFSSTKPDQSTFAIQTFRPTVPDISKNNVQQNLILPGRTGRSIPVHLLVKSPPPQKLNNDANNMSPSKSLRHGYPAQRTRTGPSKPGTVSQQTTVIKTPSQSTDSLMDRKNSNGVSVYPQRRVSLESAAIACLAKNLSREAPPATQGNRKIPVVSNDQYHPAKLAQRGLDDGNAAFAQKDYQKAVQAYSQGIMQCGSSDSSSRNILLHLHLKRAKACVELQDSPQQPKSNEDALALLDLAKLDLQACLKGLEKTKGLAITTLQQKQQEIMMAMICDVANKLQQSLIRRDGDL